MIEEITNSLISGTEIEGYGDLVQMQIGHSAPSRNSIRISTNNGRQKYVYTRNPIACLMCLSSSQAEPAYCICFVVSNFRDDESK